MREARKTPEGRWYTVEVREGVCRIGPPDWGQDDRGLWARVELEARAFEQRIACPSCGTAWVLEEFDCIFGTACDEGNDVLVLVRCTGCRLPHRVRGVGFLTAYPHLKDLMEGWSDWEGRRNRLRCEEEKFYGGSARA